MKFYYIFIHQGHQFKKSSFKEILIKSSTKQSVYLRRFSSDIYVFNEVYVRNSYKIFIDLILRSKINTNNFLDLGSNIGLATLNFHEYFPDAKFICVEPSVKNFCILKKNILINNINAQLFNNAIWNDDKNVYLCDTFRDGKDWSKNIADIGHAKDVVKGISYKTILDSASIDCIDVLKIDIEGGEFILFSDSSFLLHLKKIKAIAIEIHEEVGDVNHILTILSDMGFNMINIGDFYAGINMNSH